MLIFNATLYLHYSYSYDLTHSLQVNLAPPREFSINSCPGIPNEIYRNEESTSKEQNKVDDDDLFNTWKKQMNQRNINSG